LGSSINKQNSVKEFAVKYLHNQTIIFMKDNVKMSKKGMDMVDKFIVMVTTILDFGKTTRRMAGGKSIMQRMEKLRKEIGLMANYNIIESSFSK